MSESGPQNRYAYFIFACLFYLGFAPIFHFLRRPPNPLLLHHLRQSLAVFSLLLLVLGVFAVSVLVLSYVMVYHRDFFEAQHLETLLLTWLRRIFLCWLVFWFFGLALAVLKSPQAMPVIKLIIPHNAILHTTAATMLLFYMLLLASAALTLRAQMLLSNDWEKARVVMLYDDVDRYPAWIFHLGYYRMVSAGTARWGTGAVAVEKISPAKIEHSVQQAGFLFLGTHGQAQGLLIDGRHFKPSDIKAPRENRNLHYVYLAGCDSGAQQQAWEEAFAPAEVLTFDRLTPVIEHLWWLWVKGPDVLRSLP